jgi:hypothetical protein
MIFYSTIEVYLGLRGSSRYAIIAVVALAVGPVQGASPYPPSTVITGISWDVGSYRWGGDGGDLWPVSWALDGSLLTVWGDGQMGCPSKVSYGVAKLASDQPTTSLATIHCGPPGINKGKLMALLATGSGLFARFGPQGTSAGFPIWKSTNNGRTWTKPASPLPFLIDAFVQFGRGNGGAPGGYVYALQNRTTAIHLLRVPAGNAQSPSAYEYFNGTAAAPAWTKVRSRARPIFSDPAGTWRPSINYNPGLKRYLLVTAHSKDSRRTSDKMGVFEAPNPWGPWRTVSYTDNFLGMPGGGFWGMDFPVKWQADGGKTLWATFSCHNGPLPGTCGRYHDRLNLMRARLTVGAR